MSYLASSRLLLTCVSRRPAKRPVAVRLGPTWPGLAVIQNPNRTSTRAKKPPDEGRTGSPLAAQRWQRAVAGLAVSSTREYATQNRRARMIDSFGVDFAAYLKE